MQILKHLDTLFSSCYAWHSMSKITWRQKTNKKNNIDSLALKKGFVEFILAEKKHFVIKLG